jgi:ribosomal protein S27AE
VFCELTPQVYEIFQLLGFSEVFSIRHTLDAALDAFQRLDTAEDGPPKSLDFTCPACGSPVQGASGRFRCGRCKTLLALDAQGTVFLG